MTSVPARGPSAYTHRLPVALLATAGLVIAGYLSLFELGVLHGVWDPVFGSGSREVLTSTLATSLPVPDAVLGVLAYLGEAALALIGPGDRWRRQPWLTLAYGALATALGCTAIGLVIVQAFVVHAWCLLCLGSASISLVAFALAAPELAATLRHLRGTP
jgi:uncharacterized membrane protein